MAAEMLFDMGSGSTRWRRRQRWLGWRGNSSSILKIETARARERERGRERDRDR